MRRPDRSRAMWIRLRPVPQPISRTCCRRAAGRARGSAGRGRADRASASRRRCDAASGIADPCGRRHRPSSGVPQALQVEAAVDGGTVAPRELPAISFVVAPACQDLARHAAEQKVLLGRGAKDHARLRPGGAGDLGPQQREIVPVIQSWASRRTKQSMLRSECRCRYSAMET